MKAEQERSIFQRSTTERARSLVRLAQKLASSDGMNIGVDHIFNAVKIQMDPRSAIRVLSQNGITYFQLIEDLTFIRRDFEKIESHQEIGLTSRAENVLGRAVEHAVRGRHQLTDSDILIGIARHAQAVRLRVEAENERRRKEVDPYKIKKNVSPSSLVLPIKKY